MKQNRILHNIVSKISVTKYLDYKEYLEAIYQALKREMESYSYMQFAEDLGFARSNVMYLLIKGQRPLSEKNGKRIGQALGLKGADRKYWYDLVAYFDTQEAAERETIFQDLVEQKTSTIAGSAELVAQLEFFTEWYHGAVFELSFTSEFSEDPKELAARLMPKIRVDQAKKSLVLLEKLGLLARTEEGGPLRPTQAQIRTGHEITSMALVRYHQKMLELAKQALMTIALEEREISATSVAIKLERMPKIKKEMRAFRKKIMEIAGQDPDPDRVYQMNIQFFPMSRKKGD